MIWLTWRQHRKQLLSAVIGLAVLAGIMVPTGRQMRDAFVDTGLADCLRRFQGQEFLTPDPATGLAGCDPAAMEFSDRYGTFLSLAILFIILPLLVGLFYGAPLVAREVEHGTHRLVWTQGVSRLRWAAVKFGLITVGASVIAAGYALLLSWWIAPLAEIQPGRFFPILFDAQGVAPIGYTIFAVALGIFAGSYKNRVIPAMAVTLVGFLGARIVVAFLARPRFMPPLERKYSAASGKVVNEFLGDWVLGPGGFGEGAHFDSSGRLVDVGQAMVTCGPPPPNPTATPTGSALPPATPSATPSAAADPVGCDVGYNLQIYQPGGRYWLFQYIETGLFVGLAALLLFLAVNQVRRRIA